MSDRGFCNIQSSCSTFAVFQRRQALEKPERDLIGWLGRSFNTRVTPCTQSGNIARSPPSFENAKQMHRVAALRVPDKESPCRAPTTPFDIESPRMSPYADSSPYADRELWSEHEERHATDVRSSLLSGSGLENSRPSSCAADSTPPQSANPWRYFFKSKNDKFSAEEVGLDEEKFRERARASMKNDVSNIAKAKMQMVRDARRHSEKEAKVREKANRETGEKLRKLEAEVRAKVDSSGTGGTEMMDLRKAKKKSRSGKKTGFSLRLEECSVSSQSSLHQHLLSPTDSQTHPPCCLPLVWSK
ncbi:hypothetical protein BSKO_12741 [Bryopsis sp. KO-2023]|nr:hypothetical protein BSKO_12741 [Bryopsis sp. KO-2023]